MDKSIERLGVSYGISSEGLLQMLRRYHLLQDALGHDAAARWQPRMDVYETEEHLIIILDVAGVHTGDIDVEHEGEVLRVRGRRKPPALGQARCLKTEIPFGDFTRQFVLGRTCDPSSVEATHKDGLLTIRIPRRSESTVRSIRVGPGQRVQE